MRIRPARLTAPRTPLLLTANEWAAIRGILVSGQEYAIPAVLSVDRNGDTEQGGYGAELGNHVMTTRLSYTCPPDKIARVETIFTTIFILPAVGYARWQITINNSYVHMNWITPTTPGGYSQTTVPSVGWLYANDVLQFKTENASLTSLVFYAGYHLLVFDA